MDTINETKNTQIRQLIIQPGVSFEANGRTYTASETFTIGRFEKVEEMEEELMMFSGKKTCHQIMLQAMAHINAYKPGDAYTLLYNKIESDQRNVKLNHYILRLCAAYINYEGEDLRYLSDDTIKQKINDWAEAGLDINPFLFFAVNVFKELLQHYKQPIVNTLAEAKQIKEALEEVLDIKNLTVISGQETL